MAAVPIRIRPWRPGDERLLAGAGISPASLRSRFFAGTPRLPAAYLHHIARVPRTEWDAQVALLDRGPGAGRLVGWSEFARAGSPAEADIALLVLDRWQRRGVGSALLRSMLPRIADAGVKIVHADVELGNHAARGLLGAVLGPIEPVPPGSGHQEHLSAVIADGLLHYMLRLDGSPSGGSAFGGSAFGGSASGGQP
jgi:GNAT superfamily N-acetyltransferase